MLGHEVDGPTTPCANQHSSAQTADRDKRPHRSGGAFVLLLSIRNAPASDPLPRSSCARRFAFAQEEPRQRTPARLRVASNQIGEHRPLKEL
jgi:hypothetical protein